MARRTKVGMKLVDALMLFGSAILGAAAASILLFDIFGIDANLVRLAAIVAASAIGLLVTAATGTCTFFSGASINDSGRIRLLEAPQWWAVQRGLSIKILLTRPGQHPS